MILYSWAKVNLYLDVLGKRPDGYHNIRTIFQRVSLFDKLVIKPLPGNIIKIKTNRKDVPCGRDNIVYKGALLLKKDFGIRKGLHIELIKSIPPGSGLAGGSGNAAGLLLGLNKLWGLNLSREALVNYGRKLGADVAFFLYDTSFALGYGRGDRIVPLENIKKKLWQVIAIPGISVSTKKIYGELDRRGYKLKSPKILTQRQLLDKAAVCPQGILYNSLEQVTFRKYPGLQSIKSLFKSCGIKDVLMSGSGSAVFGIVNSRKEAEIIARKMKRLGVHQVFVASTI